MRTVPDHIARPQYVTDGEVAPAPSRAPRHDAGTIERMRKAGRLARQVLDAALGSVKPGMSTDEIDAIGHAKCIELGVYPSPLQYMGFPRSICTSVNEVICHGIPGRRMLMDGDIINIDVTIFADGVHGDCSETRYVGTPDAESVRLVEATFEAMWAGIESVRPGRPINVIGRAIAKIAKREKLGIVREFAGHGIGEWFQQPPDIVHYVERKVEHRMLPGMTFTIEPMLNLGTASCVLLDDDWTAVTYDGLRSAQFEHTILVTQDGFEVLTAGEGEPWFRRSATP